jgi:ATP-dependent Clp protease adapter protein ClpS
MAEETKTVNWMLEDFPEDVKHKCKEKALADRETLKAFVEKVLRQAVGMSQPKKQKK